MERHAVSDQVEPRIDAQEAASAVRRCVGANVRRTDRALTNFYDVTLAPSGLSARQFGLVATLAEVAPITINGLAQLMSIDRTTLTRNLGLLIKRRLVRSEDGEDRRMHLVLLTPDGEEALSRSWPLWQEAQARIEQALGRERYEALLAELAAVRALVG
jgi:DNA-binding MarR family transcriptional regulator